MKKIIKLIIILSFIGCDRLDNYQNAPSLKRMRAFSEIYCNQVFIHQPCYSICYHGSSNLESICEIWNSAGEENVVRCKKLSEGQMMCYDNEN